MWVGEERGEGVGKRGVGGEDEMGRVRGWKGMVKVRMTGW